MSIAKLANPKFQLWFWGVTTLLWAILLIPSLLWWKESILWLVMMSWWANVAASASAFLSSHAEREQGNNK